MVKLSRRSWLFALILTLGVGTLHAQDDDSGLPALADDEQEASEQEQPASQPPAATPVEAEPVAPMTPAPQLNATEPEPNATYNGPTERLFGTYRLQLGAARPEINDNSLYSDYFGKAEVYPMFAVDVFAYDWYVTFGGRFGLGYYVDRGHSSLSGVGEPYVKAPNDKIELTMIPLQAALTFETTVFKRKWLVLSGYIGYERMYFQDARTAGSSSSAAIIADTETTTSAKKYVTSGWKSGSVTGVALNISMMPLEDGSVNMMEDVMGLKTIYISPFMEIAKYPSGLNFSRTSMGVAFTFESAR